MFHTRVYTHAPCCQFQLLFSQRLTSDEAVSVTNIEGGGEGGWVAWGWRPEKGGWQHGHFQPGQQAHGPETTKINKPTKMKETTTNPKGFAQR